MQLHFLGRPYATQPTQIETSEINVSGKYRGHQVAFRKAQPTEINSAVPLQFLGKSYLR